MPYFRAGPAPEPEAARVGLGEPGSLVGATLTLLTKGQAMTASDPQSPGPLDDASTHARSLGPRSDKGDGDPDQDPDPPMAWIPSDPPT